MATFNEGRVIKDTFYLIGEPAITIPQSVNVPTTSFGCCSDYVLKVLADNTNEELQNDKSGFLWWFPDLIDTAVLKLQKYVSGAWTDIAALTSNTDYGTAYNYGFFTNDALEKFIGYQLEWALVLAEDGEGSYRVACVTTDFASSTYTLYSDEYCLKTYTPVRANGTVRIEYYLNGTLGLNSDDKKVKDLGTLNWYNSFRLGGFFTYKNSTYQEDRIKYNTGERLFVSDEQEPEYILKLKPAAFFIHNYMRTDIMQADDVYITDYNSNNVINYVQKNVYKNSGYEPKFNYLTAAKLASVEVLWKQKFNNHKKLRY